ncbi:MAG TPA: tetratricopeptide repeat protein [Thermoanaerobaculia bacterium]|nr:tetratricopeptide repeat protein [Thermoanaerobaculia bacterium]
MPAPVKTALRFALRLRHGALAPVLLLVILATGPAAARREQAPTQPTNGKPDRSSAVQKALDKSAEALRRDDYQGALAAATEAVELDPVGYEPRIRRVTILWRLRGAGKTAEDNQRIEETLRADCRAVIAAAPDSTAAGVAREALASLDRGTPLASRPAACTPEANAEVGKAEALFASRRYEDSLAHYERAAAKCPENPAIWTSYGDAYFGLGDFSKAQRSYETALAKSPWYAPAHRYLADALGRQHQLVAAYHECVLAVLSDPTYDAAWGYLRSIVLARKGTWHRVVAVKPTIKRDAAGHVEVGVDPQAVDAVWLAYALAKTAGPPRPAGAAPAPAAPQTELAREREAVRAALGVRQEAAAGASGFWDMIARADQAGLLDEAIFVHLPDTALLAEYPAYRAGHAERLVRYVETVLAPLPAAP